MILPHYLFMFYYIVQEHLYFRGNLQQLSMNQDLKSLLESIRDKQPININIAKRITSDRFQRCFIKLLLLSYNQILQESGPSYLPNKNKFWRINQVLPVISDLVNFPEPANYLAQFDYWTFGDFCQKNQMQDLFRYSKGIYPYINMPSQQIPAFIPFHESLDNIPFGNQNWQLARHVLRQRLQHNKRSKSKSFIICLCILLGDATLKVQVQDAWTNIWTQIYLKYLNQGLKMINNKNNQIKEIEEEGIQQLYIPEAQFSSIIDQNIYTLLKSMCNYQQDFQTIFERLMQTEMDQASMVQTTILYIIFKQRKNQKYIQWCQRVFQQYQQKKGQKYQYFFLVFKNKQQIISYYQNKKNGPPIQFDRQTMEEISRNHIKNKPKDILKVREFLDQNQAVLAMINSSELNHHRTGRNILTYLNDHKEDCIKILQNKFGKNQSVNQDFKYFLQSWKNYHQAIQENNENFSAVCWLLIEPTYHYRPSFLEIIHYPTQHAKSLLKIVEIFGQFIRSKSRNNRDILKVLSSNHFKQLMNKLTKTEADDFWVKASTLFLTDQTLIYQCLKTER